jgi:hypothetical protein
MIKDFNYSGRLIFSKTILGFGFILEFNPPFGGIEINWILKIDLIWIRFWIESLKRRR